MGGESGRIDLPQLFDTIDSHSHPPDHNLPQHAQDILKMPKVYLLDYVAGNVRSLVNAIEKVGYTVEWVRSPEDVENADVSYNSSCHAIVLYK